MADIDSLDIKISASVQKANASLDMLIKRLNKVSASLSGVNSRGLATMGSGVNKLANAMNNFNNNTNTAVFSRLTRNLNSLGNINPSAINNASKSIGKIVGAMQTLNNVNVTDNAKQIGDLAKGISQLGYKSSSQAVDNIPKLATGMRQLMQTLSSAPRVSQNLIDMTNALANFTRTGAGGGQLVNNLIRNINNYSQSSKVASRNSFSLAKWFGKMYASYWLLFRAFGRIGDSIVAASDLQEAQNVVDVTFGDFKDKIEDFSKTSITDFGISELTAKQIASRFQAMGTAMGVTQGKMADMSVNLTALSADMSSFYNVNQEEVAKTLRSIFTGETEPLRKFGLDLSQVTLQQWALNKGLNVNVQTMTQAEKVMLRYAYVMDRSKAAQGDFARTSDNWANQVRVLKENLRALSIVVGRDFINALKPGLKALNIALVSITNFATTVSNSLGKIFGWTFETDTKGVISDTEDSVIGVDNALSDATDSAKKLKRQLQGFDELNNLTSGRDNNGSGGGLGDFVIDYGKNGELVKTDGLFKQYESDLDTLYKLGDHIATTIGDELADIEWNQVYARTKGFGSGLANFLNGTINVRTFGLVGTTVANSLNAALKGINSFGEDFDFTNFGVSLGTSANNFFKNFEWNLAADTLNTWVQGLADAIVAFLATLTPSDVLYGLFNFLSEIELETISLLGIGGFVWKGGAKLLVKSALEKFLGTQLTGSKISLVAGIGTLAFKFGEWLSKNTVIGDLTDSLVEWLYDGEDSINIAKTISVGIAGISLSVGLASAASKIFKIGSSAKLVDASEMANSQISSASKGLAGKVFKIAIPVTIAYQILSGIQVEGDYSVSGETVGEVASNLIEQEIGDKPRIVKFPIKMATTVALGAFELGSDIKDFFGIGKTKEESEFTKRTKKELNDIVLKIKLRELGIDEKDFENKINNLPVNIANKIKNIFNKELNIHTLFNSGKNLLVGLYNGLRDNNSWISINNSTSAKTNLVASNNFNSARWISSGVKLIKGLNDGTSDANTWGMVKNGVASALKDVSDQNFSNTQWNNSGKNLVKGLQKGITDEWGNNKNTGLTGKIVNLATNLTTSLKKAFRIHSPSKLWQGVGVFLPQGLSVGIKDGEKSVLRTVNGFATDVNSSLARNIRPVGIDDILPSQRTISTDFRFDVSSDLQREFQATLSVSQTEQERLLEEQNNLLRALLKKETGITTKEVFNAVRTENRAFFEQTQRNALVY